MNLEDRKRLLVPAVGLYASGLLAAAIVVFWAVQVGRAECRVFGLVISHSRYWDALLGLYALVAATASVRMPRDERVECVFDDIAVMVVFAGLGGMASAELIFRGGMPDYRLLLAIGAFISVGTAATLWVGRFRMAVNMSIGACFGLSLYAGALAGTILSAVLALALITVFHQYHFWQRILYAKASA